MISDRDLVRIHIAGSPYVNSAVSREVGEKWLASYQRWPAGLRAETAELVPIPSCRCCGAPASPNLRCAKHQDRNPCAAEGCQRTSAAQGRLRDDWTLCGEHWRQYVPPGSPERRAFNRLARIARKAGYRRMDRWPDDLEDRWWRLWRGVIRRGRRRQIEGHLDQAAIERLFGWDEAA